MSPYQVIKTVSMTEKSNAMTEFGHYAFIVNVKATKKDVKQAVEEVFERKVATVNIMNRKGKVKRTRVGVGRKANWKKAIVTLKPDQEPLELF